MSRSRLSILGASLVLITAIGCESRRDAAQRVKLLTSLCATNAPLSVAESELRAHLVQIKRGSPEWTRMVTNYQTLPYPRYKKALTKMNTAAGLAYTSTKSIVTVIYLDESDRMIDFTIDAQ